MPKTSIVIVNYRTPALTLKLVEKLFSMYGGQEFRVYVVENASPDDSFLDLTQGLGSLCAKIQKRFQIVLEEENLIQLGFTYKDGGVLLYRSLKNKGFASGNNKILRILMDAPDEDYVWLLNPDTDPSSTALKELLCFSEDRSEAIIGSVIINNDRVQCFGGSKIIKALGIPKGLRANEKFGNLNTYESSKNTPESLSFISGASMFFSIKTLKTIGLMPEEYFLYWEEADWCEQAKKKGIRLEVCPLSHIQHATSASVGLRSNFQYRIDMRNTLIFASKHCRPYIPLILALKPLVNFIVFIKKEKAFSVMPLLSSWRGAFDWLSPRRPERK